MSSIQSGGSIRSGIMSRRRQLGFKTVLSDFFFRLEWVNKKMSRVLNGLSMISQETNSNTAKQTLYIKIGLCNWMRILLPT